MGLIIFILLSGLASFSDADISTKVGVNYGQLGNNLRSPSKSVHLIKSLGAKRVKIYDANPRILGTLRNTGIQVSVMVPNEIINNITANPAVGYDWVLKQIVPFYPKTRIRYILVGNEILTVPDNSTWFNLVPCMRIIKRAARKFGLHKVKVGTTSAMDVLESSFPPSNGTFRRDISENVMRPMLQFLNRTKSFFFLDVYPFFVWSDDPTNINLDYALLSANNITVYDSGSGLTYTNLLDQMLDAVHFAMKRLGYPDIRIFVAETGWPNSGDVDQIGANIYNAATYNRNVVKKFLTKPTAGTPARPGVGFPSFIFSLYNENLKPGPGTERHFGMLYPNGTQVYEIDLTGKTKDSEYKPLPKPTNNKPYKGKVWCVVAEGADTTAVQAAVSYACGQGNHTCDPIQRGGNCFQPDSLFRHASYAFSSYWAQFKSVGGTCYFNGVAAQTTKDPSFGSCKFPSVTL